MGMSLLSRPQWRVSRGGKSKRKGVAKGRIRKNAPKNAPPAGGVEPPKLLIEEENAILVTEVDMGKSRKNACIAKGRVEPMKPDQLAAMLNDPKEKVMLLDCRSFLDFNEGHILNAVNVWCSKLLSRRLQQNKVSAREILSNTFHLELEDTRQIVLYDQNSQDLEDLDPDGFVSILMDRLTLTFPAVVFLRGVELERHATGPEIDRDLNPRGKMGTCDTFECGDSHGCCRCRAGGFRRFHKEHAELCEDAARWRPILKTLSQPCLSCVRGGPTKVLPFLFLGSEHDAADQEFFHDHNVDYVLNVSLSIPKPEFIKDSHFMRIPVNDSCNEKLRPHFEKAFQFLDMVQESGGNVLVHCHAGISRSPTVVIGYVMKRLHLTSEEAFRYVKSKRVIVAPNFNFLGQLLEYEEQLKHDFLGLHKVQTAPATVCISGIDYWEHALRRTPLPSPTPITPEELSPNKVHSFSTNIPPNITLLKPPLKLHCPATPSS
ncbi:unnamed protein product [Darwinula stevensoni]|uniref:protein-tyrosine-phosphatase n=1 Tax=Darwinula stevensoni TaxID=69355 RepID=A0A7R9AB90_9CRUS|nr:unnamed protein product [Darwinula stevensoni]CAG0899060.1 unnamed protein product [Darwinula stevensoni]